MKVSELIRQLSDTMQAVGDLEVKTIQLFENEDGEDRNSESDIFGVYTQCPPLCIYVDIED